MKTHLAIFLGPLAWFANLTGSFALAPRACLNGEKLPLYAVSLAALLLTVVAGSISAFQYQRINRTAEAPDQMTQSPRLAIAGMALSALCLALILAQAIPNLMMGGCE